MKTSFVVLLFVVLMISASQCLKLEKHTQRYRVSPTQNEFQNFFVEFNPKSPAGRIFITGCGMFEGEYRIFSSTIQIENVKPIHYGNCNKSEADNFIDRLTKAKILF